LSQRIQRPRHFFFLPPPKKTNDAVSRRANSFSQSAGIRISIRRNPDLNPPESGFEPAGLSHDEIGLSVSPANEQ